jgi:hypothetical protein
VALDGSIGHRQVIRLTRAGVPDEDELAGGVFEAAVPQCLDDCGLHGAGLAVGAHRDGLPAGADSDLGGGAQLRREPGQPGTLSAY